jgi:hypothetical protein
MNKVKSDPSKDKDFAQVVKPFLTTPLMLHKEKNPKSEKSTQK